MENISDKINELWNDGNSYTKIQEKLGITRDCVKYHLSNKGRRAHERKKAKEIADKIFSDKVINVVSECNSLYDICKKLNVKCVSGYLNKIKKVIEKNNLDISHFGKKETDYKNRTKLSNEEYFVNGKNRNGVNTLNRLINVIGKERKCENCGRFEWEGENIPLQIHHINGDHFDNRIENLQILCPNCHSMTDSFCKKNIKKNNKEKILVTKITEEIYNENFEKENLLRLFKRYKTFTKVGKILGISDNGVRKRCKKLGILDEVRKLKEKNRV